MDGNPSSQPLLIYIIILYILFHSGGVPDWDPDVVTNDHTRKWGKGNTPGKKKICLCRYDINLPCKISLWFPDRQKKVLRENSLQLSRFFVNLLCVVLFHDFRRDLGTSRFNLTQLLLLSMTSTDCHLSSNQTPRVSGDGIQRSWESEHTTYGNIKSTKTQTDTYTKS